MDRTVEVIAPARLHFGMFSFGRRDTPQFGGVGAMVDAPATRLRFAPAARFELRGPRQDRVRGFVARLVKAWSLDRTPACQIEVLAAPRAHVGLGLGTQLGLSVAKGLHLLLDRPPVTPEQLARAVGRGERSAVGTYGFFCGGLVVEAGKKEKDLTGIGPLVERLELPATWRFVLLCPKAGVGLSGAAEARAFAQLPPVPPATAATLRRLALEQLVPAAAASHFDQFSAALYEYGCLAGACFAARQGGSFATPRLARLVESIRAAGVAGVGQSSWGPTLFALLPDVAAAEAFVGRFGQRPETRDVELVVAAPNRSGARIQTDPLSTARNT